jgi:hypothetical protein
MGAVEDAIFKISQYTKLSQKDIDDLDSIAKTNPDALPGLMQDYIDMAAVPDRGVWVKIGEDLQAAGPYIGLAGAIVGVCSGLWGLIKS